MELPEVGSAQGEQLAARHAAERHPYSSAPMVQERFWVEQVQVWSFEQEGWTAAVSPEEWVVCSSVLMELPVADSAQGQLAALYAAERRPYSSVQLIQVKFWVQQARVWSSEQEG